jgi:hemerythrin
MKTPAILPLLLLASALAWSQAGNAVSEYAGLRDKVKSGDLSIDFQRLRISYVDSPEHRQAKDTDDQKKRMIQAINAKDFTKALKNAEAVLDSDYSDMDAHFAEYIAYRETDDSKQAEFHRSVFDGLIKSILNSGDGKSEETAYVVASVPEEYVVLRVMGLQIRNQSLAHNGGHSYDVLEVKEPKSGKTSTLYFNVDVSMNHLLNLFGGKK